MRNNTFIDRLKRIDELIKEQSTGNALQLAMKIGVSERTIYEDISFLKYLGAPLKYSRQRQTYYYWQSGGLKIAFEPGL